ncbi:trigger factor [Parabacteroides sp. PF5-9]|uniref:trigger factor n=1 Tax=Parabacteroides sp. PF5-9 TaxID=1742404 RepID=UPI0024744DF6|nr:trigger factor [Parabacteroides sp. PF5-9]MDH6358800.1 trigger factor [Parabacteroides sp. PF5-9]
MNVSLKNNDAVSGIITLEIAKADYTELVEKNLRNYRQKANIPGFRKGMVPMGMIKKMYGKYVLIEEVNKLASENLYKYIRENKLNLLGEPIPNETEQKTIDFDTQEDFEFCFDIALAPEINITLNKRDKAPYYQVIIDEDMINKQVDSYRSNFGSYEKADNVEERDMVKGTVAELENGSPKEGGIVVEEAVLMPMYIKEESEKGKFIGATANSVIVFNPHKAYEGAETEIASFLKIDKEKVAEVTGDFSFEIKEITRHKDSELNQELFDRVLGEGVVASEEEFKAKIKEILAGQFTPQSDYKFLQDIRQVLLKKAGELTFADDILKRWLLMANENNTKEKIEDDYPQIIEDLKYQLIKEHLVKTNELKVEEADIEELAKRVAQSQFAQYGMLSVPDDILTNYAKDLLKNKDTLQNVIDRAIEDKLATWLKQQIKLEEKEITVDDFNKLFE